MIPINNRNHSMRSRYFDRSKLSFNVCIKNQYARGWEGNLSTIPTEPSAHRPSVPPSKCVLVPLGKKEGTSQAITPPTRYTQNRNKSAKRNEICACHEQLGAIPNEQTKKNTIRDFFSRHKDRDSLFHDSRQKSPRIMNDAIFFFVLAVVFP